METTTRKPWSEFALLLTLGTALLIAAAATDAFGSLEAWTLLAVLGAGYALSRGVARNDLRLPERPRRIRAVMAPGTTDAATAETETAAEVVVSEEQLQVDK